MIDTRRRIRLASGTFTYHALSLLEDHGLAKVSRLPVSLRIVLESVLRNADGRQIRDEDVEALARWEPTELRTSEVPFFVGRVLLQDFTGVPLLVDLAALRTAVARRGGRAELVQPRVPVDLVIDHSVQVDYSGRPDALRLNTDAEFVRNEKRYEFLAWGAQAFDGIRVFPPVFGICHQVNLEFLARGVLQHDGVLYPDTLVGTDSHTTMVNGLGVLGWGVGGIEAEAALLGQPVHMLLPDVVGVHLEGDLREGVTATDLVLHVTERLRREGVVGKFVEFHGSGAAALRVPDRATLGNMAPEYGATVGFFPFDEESCRYLLATGRTAQHVDQVREYFKAQGLFGIPKRDECEYSSVIDVELDAVEPSIAGPKRPQDRIALDRIKSEFARLLTADDGYAKSPAEVDRHARVSLGLVTAPKPGGGDQSEGNLPGGCATNTSPLSEGEMMANRPTPDRLDVAKLRSPAPTRVSELTHGAVVIAAITSCTNTSNPAVMLGAGLLAKMAVAHGLSVKPWVKTSMAPGSRVVSEYLTRTGLQPYLDRLGFQLVGFGCTTCIGNSGPIDRAIEEAITSNELITASVLSGNRNFEARIHQSVKANFLMSPPLVVAFAIAGRIGIDFTSEPLGIVNGREVFLRDVWPSAQEIDTLLAAAYEPDEYRRVYSDIRGSNPQWSRIQTAGKTIYDWNPESLYIREPPYFDDAMTSPGAAGFSGGRPLAIFGDSITTDHISPAGEIQPSSPAGKYLRARGVAEPDFNTYGARRGNHDVMVRGTFANIRIRNLMVPGVEGGVTVQQPSGERMSIYDAAQWYRDEGVPLVVIAGTDYGAGSSRDWAAKGTRLLGVRAVIATGFERIHRSNLVGMGVLPCEFPPGESAQTLGLDGTETFALELSSTPRPRQTAQLKIERRNGERRSVPLLVRIDTPIEAAYYEAGGILPYVLQQLLAREASSRAKV